MQTFIITSPVFNPYFNAALEEWLLTEFRKNELVKVIYFWQNANTIVVGRNQNTYAEVNLKELESDKVNLFRRFSGGGAVFHDLGNICFSIILPRTGKVMENAYEQTTRNVVKFLNSLNVPAVFHGRNDLEIDNKKFSGLAEYIAKDRLLVHGTLLFDTDFSKLAKYLNVDKTKIASKGVDSVAKRVVNVKEYLPNWTTAKFLEEMINFFTVTEKAETIVLTKDALAKVEKRAKEHFQSWEWNFGKTYEYNFKNKRYFNNAGLFECNVQVEKGTVVDIKFYGDFLSVVDITPVTKKLIGQKYDYKTFEKLFNELDHFSDYFGSLKPEQLLEVIFDNK
ncbi:lipoate--protein ligase [Mycoplasmoides genitalium]|uniref:lipoate--protein ligase n=1 Tax=Mycoplasmoides genitalium TaxID=2097 RepID=UPI00027B3E2C|nr:lipoate--protein ligase [Mycoplasmoides genitalium]AFQ03104.1 lipoyltransferase/lipoate-protein ligase [Mycoplasmoides genitalium M2321]AFQ03592.1 lipoyltransferase/lipoate-protein ligase [Mycoplasmoides genitalium M6282]